MKSLSTQVIAAAALAVAGLGAMSAAHARSDVFLSIGLQGAPVYVEPAPVYYEPRPVYVQPQPVYVQPRPVYAQPRAVYVETQPVYRYEGEYSYNWERRHRGERHGRRFGPYGDMDHDGVPNRYDRFPDDPYRN